MKNNHSNARTVLIIGAGAAGLMAGIRAAEKDPNRQVLIAERMERPGRKLLITGKGRCNVTNCCTIEEFMPNVLTSPRFLYSSLNALSPYEVMGFFEECGVPLKVERGERVFPVSDHSSDIVNALVQKAKDIGCRFLYNCRIKELLLDGKSVKIDDLAIFGVGIRSKAAETLEEFSLEKNITGMRLRARATGNLSTNNLKLDSQLKQQAEYQKPTTAGGGSDSDDNPDPKPDGGGEAPDPAS